MNDRINAVKQKFRQWMKDSPQFGVSVIVHLLVFGILATFYVETGRKPKVAQVISEIEEQRPEEEFQEELEEEIDLEAPVSLTPTGGAGEIAEPSEMMPMPTQSTAIAAVSEITNRTLSRPLSGSMGDLGLDSNVSGLKGTSEVAGEGGDAGVIDRITQEILRQLNKNKVIVVWVMDSSGSLKERREDIAKRLDRVYYELKELGVQKDEALVTAIVGAGGTAQFLMEQPTANNEEVAKAIRAIKEDETGIENLFTAVRESALKYRRFQTSGRRTMMIILLTDEIGDDTSVSDETVDLLKRNKVPLYAMGPVASFSRPILHDLWIDPETKFRFWIPITRGPYTREEEVCRVAFNGTPYLSGFGPFAMTQITRETGGIFFIYDDDRIIRYSNLQREKYDPEILMRYKANYGSKAEYAKEIAASKLRQTLMEVASEGNKVHHVYWPHHWIHAEVWKEDIERNQQQAAIFIAFAKRALPILEAAEKEWSKETHPRWRASFDLSYARILQAYVRCEEYNWAHADFKMNPRTLKDPKKNNGWHIRWTPNLNIGRKPGSAAGEKEQKRDTNVGASNPKAEQEEKAMVERRCSCTNA